MTAQLTPPDAATFDGERAEAFADRMLAALNEASVALMSSIGHQVGLFDALATLPPATSAEIADAAGLIERYVREWLAAMTAARIVEYDPQARTYWLPREHAACLTRTAGPNNLAHVLQFVTLLAQVEEGIVTAFREGGGVGYDAYPHFHRLMAEDSAIIHDASLLDEVIPLVDGLTDRLEQGIAVADIGCGSGHAINLLAQAYPASTFVGYDYAEEGIATGRAEAATLGLTNAAFELCDVATLDADARYDLITAFDAIHDQAHPGRVLANIARALRPGGVFLMVDIKASSNLEQNLELPTATFLYTVSTLHCMTVSLSQGGDGLGTAWGEQLACRMLREAGFTEVEVKTTDTDFFNSYYVATRA